MIRIHPLRTKIMLSFIRLFLYFVIIEENYTF